MEKILPIAMVLAGVGAILMLVLAFLSMNATVSSAAAKEIVKEAKLREKYERRERILSRFYLLMTKIPFGGRYLRKTESMYAMICPYEQGYLQRLSATTSVMAVMLSIIASFAVAALGFFVEGHISIYSFACIIFAIYVVCREVLQSRISKTEMIMMNDLTRYIAAVKHLYDHYRNIPRAVLEASEGLHYELRLHALHMNEILTSADRAERVKEYALSQRTNRYLKMFIVQAYSASERGDVKSKTGESIFSKNMEALRLEIMQDIRMKEKRGYKLKGYTFVAVIPIFFMEVLRSWGLDFSPELRGFYNGAGHFVVVLSFLATIFIYSIINKAREVNEEWAEQSSDYLQNIANKGTVKRALEKVEKSPRKMFKNIKKMLVDCGDNTALSVFFLKMLFIGIIAVAFGLVFLGVIHQQEKTRLMHDPAGIETIITSISANQLELVENAVLTLARENKGKSLTIEQLSAKFEERIPTANVSIVKAAGEEIYRRIEHYKNEYIHWYEYAILLVFGFMCSFIPVISLSYRHKLILSGKDNEVRQFQAIILMERMFPNITIVSLLEEMETFAVMFRPSIRECINSYSSGPRQALLNLKEQESDHIWFTELIDGLLSADSVGIDAAFEEVEHNREMFERIKELESEMALDKKKDSTDLLANLPMTIVLAGYFIIPFFVHSLGGVGDMFGIMETMQNIGF